MREIDSLISGRQYRYDGIKEVLESCGYAVGGNWNYEGGSFDKAVETHQDVVVRIPFLAIDGHFDAESDNETIIELRSPLVLKHVVQRGNDPHAEMHLMGAMIDQFQTPVQPDAEVSDEEWKAGRQLIQQIEYKLNK
ncbi:YugN family protein [Paenibacillus sp. UMB4589-SE434]|uniref:YugN family protein n=1 Tax=Paenibacillus sp. UMB4589-SE434 TaxID=3046314 RepID=UPI002549E708|nr:YugN family protein [Paenibacillus sp. UMB4589-SE434]MDK8183115.1 YugN family protein [Paenibacillus sp. UMB4589-SE434]